MLALWIYLGIAGAGLLALPSYGAYYRATRVWERGYEAGEIRRRRDGDDESKQIDWWRVGMLGDYHTSYEDWCTYPTALGIKIVAWPITLALYASMYIHEHAVRLLALPGKLAARSIAHKNERDKFIKAGEREVEKLLMAKAGKDRGRE